MGSLFERMDISVPNGNLGPIRNRGGRAVSAPYDRSAKLGQSKADEVTVWKHDRYHGPGKTLDSRISDSSVLPKVDASGAVQALRQAVGVERRQISGTNLRIKGASAVGSNVVQIENLTSGTTAADVEDIFKRLGPILESRIHGPKDAEKVTVRVKFKNSEDAKRAVAKFDGERADGNILSVSIVGSASTVLGGRLGGARITDGSVDVLMDDVADNVGGSKMRSDELLSDPRAQVLTVPPGVDSADYEQRGSCRGRGIRRGGRGIARRMQRTESSMLIDRLS